MCAFREFIALPNELRTFEGVAAVLEDVTAEQVALWAEAGRWGERANRHDRLALEAAQVAAAAEDFARAREAVAGVVDYRRRLMAPFEAAVARHEQLIRESADAMAIVASLAEMFAAHTLAERSLLIDGRVEEVEAAFRGRAMIERWAWTALVGSIAGAHHADVGAN